MFFSPRERGDSPGNSGVYKFIDRCEKICNPRFQRFALEKDLPGWEALLSRDQAIGGLMADFPPAIQAFFEPLDIKAFLVLPIVIEGLLSGFIGLDNMLSERSWNSVEENLLRTAAAGVAHAIIRERAQQTARLAATTFEKIAAEERALGAILRFSHESSSEEGFLQQALETLFEGVSWLGLLLPG